MTETALSRKKIQNGWAMYDWANSVYNLVIGTAIFPIFRPGPPFILRSVLHSESTEQRRTSEFMNAKHQLLMSDGFLKNVNIIF